MAQDIFDNAFNQGLIAKTKLKNKYGRDFLNNTSYFDNLDVNGIKFDEMATDLHVMTKTEDGDFVSEPLNVALSRIKATNSIAKSTKPGSNGLTEAEYAMKDFWFNTVNSGMGLHIYVNTEPDVNKPKRLEPKFIDITNTVSSLSTNVYNSKELENLELHEGSIEDRGRDVLSKAKSAGRHCDSKGWLNFKKFFSGKETKARLQREYDDYQALKVTVAENETKMKAAAQSKCETYSSTDPDRIATIEKETFEANKREVEKYNEAEKAANMQLAAKVIAKCADKLPDFEKMHAHYINALMDYEGFNKHTMGQTNSILGNEKEEAALISYISQPGTDRNRSRLEKIVAAAKESYNQSGAISFDKPEPENIIHDNAFENVENNNETQLSETALQYIGPISMSPKTNFFSNKSPNIAHALIKNNAVFEKYFSNVPDDKASSVFKSEEFKNEMYSEENINILKLAHDKMGNASLDDMDNVAKEKLREATSVVYKGKDMQSAGFVADRVMDALAINDNDKISAETKNAMRNAISSNKAVKSFVKGKSLDDIKSMQNDPKKKQEYQNVIVSVLKQYNPNLSDGKAARPKPIEKKPHKIAPKNKENSIG